MRCSTPPAACANPGATVVIGVLDMHGKPEEAEATRDFETVGASAHGELDLDGVLRRRPQVALDRQPRARQPRGLAPSEALEATWKSSSAAASTSTPR
jgi:hypothetical protein